MTDDTTPVIAAAYRTPQGKDGGVYADVRGEDLSTRLIDHLLAETGLESDHVDDLMWGVAQQRGEQDNNVARVIALLSELGEGVPATSITRWCASSMQAIISAADAIAAGNRECVIAGGMEHMSRVPMDGDSYAHLHPELSERYNVFQLQMGMTAEKVAEEYDVSRETQDAYAARSQQRATAATEEGGSTTRSSPSRPRKEPSPRTRASVPERPPRSWRGCRRSSPATGRSPPATPHRSPMGPPSRS